AAPPPQVATPTPATPVAQGRTCMTYAGAGWRQRSQGSLNECVQAVFAGHCVHPGEAEYARWGEQTLRLVPGRVGISDDNHSFRPLVVQDDSCALPPVG